MSKLKQEYKYYVSSLKNLYKKTVNVLERTNPSITAEMTKAVYHMACLTHMIFGIRHAVGSIVVKDYNKAMNTMEINGYNVAVPSFYAKILESYLSLLKENQKNLTPVSPLFPIYKRQTFETKLPSLTGMSITQSTKIIAKLYVVKSGDVKATFRMMGLRNALFNNIILKELNADGYKYDAETNTLYLDGKKVEKRGFSEPIIKRLRARETLVE